MTTHAPRWSTLTNITLNFKITKLVYLLFFLLLYISTAANRWLMASRLYHPLGFVPLPFRISVQPIKAIVCTALFIKLGISKKEESTRFVELYLAQQNKKILALTKFTFERSRESVSGTFDDASHHEKLAALAS